MGAIHLGLFALKPFEPPWGMRHLYCIGAISGQLHQCGVLAECPLCWAMTTDAAYKIAIGESPGWATSLQRLRAEKAMKWNAPLEDWKLFTRQFAAVLTTDPRLRKELSHQGGKFLTAEELIQASHQKQIKNYSIQLRTVSYSGGKGPTGYQFRAALDLGNWHYNAWCIDVLGSNYQLNVEHCADLVEAALSLWWIDMQSPLGMGNMANYYKDLVQSLTDWQPKTLDALASGFNEDAVSVDHPPPPNLLARVASASAAAPGGSLPSQQEAPPKQRPPKKGKKQSRGQSSHRKTKAPPSSETQSEGHKSKKHARRSPKRKDLSHEADAKAKIAVIKNKMRARRRSALQIHKKLRVLASDTKYYLSKLKKAQARSASTTGSSESSATTSGTSMSRVVKKRRTSDGPGDVGGPPAAEIAEPCTHCEAWMQTPTGLEWEEYVLENGDEAIIQEQWIAEAILVATPSDVWVHTEKKLLSMLRHGNPFSPAPSHQWLAPFGRVLKLLRAAFKTASLEPPQRDHTLQVLTAATAHQGAPAFQLVKATRVGAQGAEEVMLFVRANPEGQQGKDCCMTTAPDGGKMPSAKWQSGPSATWSPAAAASGSKSWTASAWAADAWGKYKK